MLERGLNAERFLEGVFIFFRDLLVASRWKDEGIKALPLSEGEKAFLREESPFWKEEDLWRILEFCTRNLPRARFGLKTEIAFGMFLGLFPEGGKNGKISQTSEDKTLPVPAPPVSPKEEPGFLPEQPGTPAGSGIQEADAKLEEPSEEWDEILECFRKENILLYSACVAARGTREEGIYSLIFPEHNRFAFEMASSPRSLNCLDSIRKKIFPDLKMDLVCGGRKVEVEALPEVKGGKEQAVPRKRTPRGKVEAIPQLEKDTDSRNDTNGLEDIQSFFNAELLVLSDEDQDLTEPQEGATEEQ